MTIQCLFSDQLLRDMVSRYSGTILPEKAALEIKREGADRTMFDQIVAKLVKHQDQFPQGPMMQVVFILYFFFFFFF